MFEQQMDQLEHGPTVDAAFRATTVVDGTRHVVHLAGELDLAGRRSLLRACIPREHRSVVVDMDELSFMDCAGFGALTTARLVLERRGGGLTRANVGGQPARLIEMLERAS